MKYQELCLKYNFLYWSWIFIPPGKQILNKLEIIYKIQFFVKINAVIYISYWFNAVGLYAFNYLTAKLSFV